MGVKACRGLTNFREGYMRNFIEPSNDFERAYKKLDPDAWNYWFDPLQKDSAGYYAIPKVHHAALLWRAAMNRAEQIVAEQRCERDTPWDMALVAAIKALRKY